MMDVLVVEQHIYQVLRKLYHAANIHTEATITQTLSPITSLS